MFIGLWTVLTCHVEDPFLKTCRAGGDGAYEFGRTLDSSSLGVRKSNYRIMQWHSTAQHSILAYSIVERRNVTQ